jgi:hypothetical protein
LAGTQVRIVGSGFDGARQVVFGDVPAAFVVDGYEGISAIAPDGPAGTVAVRVLDAAGRSGAAPLSFTYTPSADAPTTPLATGPAASASACPRCCATPSRARCRSSPATGCRVALAHTGHAKKPPSHVKSQSAEPGSALGAGDVLTVRLG